MQGCGDDLVVLDGAKVPDETPEHLPGLAQRILNRGFGVGGNALVVLGASAGGVLPVTLPGRGRRRARDLLQRRAVRRALRLRFRGGQHQRFSDRMRRDRNSACRSSTALMSASTWGPRSAARKRRKSGKASVTRSPGPSWSMGVRSRTRRSPSDDSYAMIFVPNFSFPLRRTAREIACPVGLSGRHGNRVRAGLLPRGSSFARMGSAG